MLSNILIVGVGLIGGSFALALRQAGQVAHISGIDRSLESLECAKSLHIVDTIAATPEQQARAIAAADLILIAAPVAQTGAILAAMLPHVRPDAIITDTGSTKADVVAAARRVMGQRVGQFVPGHPIAGRESNGPAAAIPDLYRGKKAVITRLPENQPQDIDTVTSAWRACGAIIHYLSPEEHDGVFASVSHLPHLLAYALVDDIARKPHAETLFQYAASGFRDFTRIAGSSPEMWRDISLANQAALLRELDDYMLQLTRLREHLAAGNGRELESVFKHAQTARQTWIRTIEAAEQQYKEGGD